VEAFVSRNRREPQVYVDVARVLGRERGLDAAQQGVRG